MSEFAKRPEIDIDEFERRLRQPAAPKPEADPLAELARILGGSEQDPFKTVFAAEQQHQQAQGRREPSFAPQDQPQQAYQQPHAAMPQDMADMHMRGSIPPQGESYHNAGGYPAYEPTRPQDDQVWDDQFDDAPAAYAPPRKPRFSRAAMMAAAIVGVGVLGIGATYAFKGKLPGSREIAMIQASNTPVKVAPQVNDSDQQAQSASLLEKGAPQGGATKVVSREEQPVDLNTLPQKTARVIPMRQQADGQVASAPTPPPQQQQTIGNLIEPRKVKTVSVRPDGSIIPGDGASGGSVPLPVSRPVMTTAPSPSVAAPKASTPKAVARVATTPPSESTPAVARPVAARTPVEPAKAKSAALDEEPTATTRGAWSAQLAASPSEDEARATASRFASKYASELGGRRPSFRKADVNSRTVYRVRVGGLSKEEATAICQKISGCFVARN